MRFSVVVLAALAAVVAVAVATSSHGSVTFEPTVNKVVVKRPQFAAPKQSVNSDFPQPLATAVHFVKAWVPNAEFVVKDYYVTKRTGVAHVYLRQMINGLEVANGDANVNVDSKGAITSASHSFFTGAAEATTAPRVNAVDAARVLATYVGARPGDIKLVHAAGTTADGREATLTQGEFASTEIKARLRYIQADGALRLVWNINADTTDNWFDGFVNALNANVEALYDWVHYASYNVYPIGVNDPDDGERTVVVDPHTLKASPLGWHDQGNGASYTTTIGNNVYAQENWSGSTGNGWINNYRPDAGASLNFNYPIDFNQDPTEYIDAAVTNLFVWNNWIHDILYEYGFDEVSGNFQENNFDNGGLGVDAVQANAQDGAGYNNANFATPPDGQRPRMRMYLWTTETPLLDGDLDNVIIHEYLHGLSNRLTGGPGNTGCLGSGEAGGMGEGWGDCYSIVLRWRSEFDTNSTDFGMGVYAAGEGIRLYDYSRNLTVNPQTYSYINGAQYGGVHAKGCFWCTSLYDLFLMLVDKYGFDEDQFTGRGGNNRWLLMVTDGMKLQPCRPTMVDARDAIIESNVNNYGGVDVCDIWAVFARRGLGVSASSGVVVADGFDVPATC